MSQPIYLTADIRRIEQAAGALSPSLMERAGAAAAERAARIAGDAGKDVLVLAGPGNNGGDAYEVAANLKAKFFRVTLVAPADPASLPADAARAARKWRDAGGETLRAVPRERKWSLVVDGLFGIGLTREPSDDYAPLIDYANGLACPRLALDVPSGLDSDSGRALGRALRASHTVTFIAWKPGLLTLDGPDYCGEVSVADLGLEVERLVVPDGGLVEPHAVSAPLRPRPRNFHKGQAGSVVVLGGASGMIGAALLAGRAALRLGAGRVYVGLLAHDAPGVDSGAPELMLRHPDEALGMDVDAFVVGPGLGQGERAEALLAAALAIDTPCVLDADALNLVAASEDLRRACARRRAPTVLTPHPAEAARLLIVSTEDIQNGRVAAARRLAAEFNAHAVLKGNGSILAAPGGRWQINTTGNPGMASAGMGDVLAGFVGTLLAQGYPADAALALGVHLHGAAADGLAQQGEGPVGIVASDTLSPARRLLNAWLAQRAQV